ncbi:MAG TPA: universal stress protein [Polyangiaceae bacterium]|nr:universal stress protein [Polyangiaceae bacterium]
MTTNSNAAEKPTRIVAATDLSELGDRAVLAGLRMASLQPKSELHVVAVAFGEGDQLRLPWEDLERRFAQVEGEQKLRERVASLIAMDPPINADNIEGVAMYLTSGAPAPRIVQLAERIDADLVVCGTHGRTGVRRLVMGSVAEEIVRKAPCGVLVIRPRDFYRGDKLPEVQPELDEGTPSLRPFHHSLVHHYRDRAQSATSRMMDVW